eukprot:CAMPEP_0172762774 /NCGR_PEP_ID=MMETSP1074-20121228/174141_1 /TAXON_ID=2916 /ORGANISM="Ceratium fusus, Strain PA161109" /LENGTH=264 /DNA_ID=CAMNT_0013597233 /DNA_START=83 /DNA_END=877 /DNA_ORIENTATION=+
MTGGAQLVCACVCVIFLTAASAEVPVSERFEGLIQNEEDRRKGLPLIMQLVRVHDAEVIKYYLDQKGTEDINATTSDGTSAIWHAALGMKKDTVAVLAEYGADLHVQKKKSGLTPLMVAAMNGDEGCVGALLKAGVDMDQTATSAGGTAMALALQSGHVQSAQQLLDGGSKIDLSTHAWKMVVRLSLKKKEEVAEAARLAFIRDAIVDNPTNKDIYETLEFASQVAATAEKKGKVVDNDPDFDEPWGDEKETAQLAAPPGKDEL